MVHDETVRLRQPVFTKTVWTSTKGREESERQPCMYLLLSVPRSFPQDRALA